MVSRIALAAAPLAAALLAVALVAAAGFSQRTALPPSVAAVFYGFFLDTYPLYAFALVYGLARLLVVAAGPGPASLPRRLIGAGIGLALLLALSLYPTFGGLVLRSAFAVGGFAFITQAPLWLATAFGTAVGAAMFGGALGLGAVLASGGVRPAGGWARGFARAGLGFLALWAAAALIGLGREAGIGPWPRRAFAPDEALRAAGLVLAAGLPPALAALALNRRAS